MDFKQIQELVKMINKSNISELSIEQDKFKITIKQKDNEIQQVIAVPAATAPIQTVATVAPAAAPVTTATQTAPAAAPAKDNLITIKSPMIGTFYRSAGPDKAAFVNVGDEVTSGKVVCIIEAMKLFNEIESEVSGKIVKVLVDDASPVEYDQPLFLVEP
jgi:acetyl-CoA carboxylase biotin carboxyl carrier protein